jgi:hypothetical protein
MAGRRRPVHCQGWHDGQPCGGVATWRKDWTEGGGFAKPEPGYLCDVCGWAAGAGLVKDIDLEPVDDGRIRGSEDVGPRLAGALERAALDSRLSALNRDVHRVYCTRSDELGWVEIMAGDVWVCQELGLEPRKSRNSVRRSRARLEALGYIKTKEGHQVSSYALKDQIATRKAAGKRPVNVIEVCKAPPWPTCANCGGPIPDIERVSKKYCGATCRKAAQRTDPRLEALLNVREVGILRDA